MKSFFALIFLAFLAVGCSKEATTNSRLKGKWTVDRKQSNWYGNTPQYSEKLNYGTMEFDNKGNGTFTTKDSVVVSTYKDTVWHSSVSYSVYTKEVKEALIFDLKHSFEDVGEVIVLTFKENKDTIGVNWSWDKKSFTLVSSFGSNGTAIYSCNKEK